MQGPGHGPQDPEIVARLREVTGRNNRLFLGAERPDWLRVSLNLLQTCNEASNGCSEAGASSEPPFPPTAAIKNARTNTSTPHSYSGSLSVMGTSQVVKRWEGTLGYALFRKYRSTNQYFLHVILPFCTRSVQFIFFMLHKYHTSRLSRYNSAYIPSNNRLLINEILVKKH